MIQEAYVSFEVAKLLKEKGFNWRTQYVYTLDGTGSTPPKMGNWRAKSNIQKPTQQMAMKWLRKVHNILLFILPAQENGKLAYLVEVWTWNDEEGIYESTYAPMPRKEPEQAVEAALKYCLEKIIK